MAKFKVGDKVRASEEGLIKYPQYLKEGETYTISQADDDDTVTVREFEKWFCESRFELLISDSDCIADLERQLETWKVIQRTNDASIKMWQELHQKDQQCLIHMAKRLNHVTAQNVELKRINEDCAQAIAMFKALNE